MQRAKRSSAMSALVTTVAVAACALIHLLASAQSDGPQPQDATAAILAAFDRYDVVGMSAAHSNEKQDNFILALVRHPGFSQKVNDIVVECGNRRYQAILDRYVAGDDIPLADARQVWRNTTVLMCGLSGFYDDLFPAVRELNRTLPVEKRLRVLAGDPPVDWTLGDRAAVLRSGGSDRDASIASVMMTEVLPKHHKALMLFGTGHLYHDDGRGTAVNAYEKSYPGRTFVVGTHEGFAAFFDLPRGHLLEARMAGWPTPSIVVLKGSWLAELDLPYFLWPFPKRMAGKSITNLADAYLYLGAGASMTYERTPETILGDRAYIAELSRRFGPVDVEALGRRNLDRELFTPADRAEARTFAPGAECVGGYARQPGDAPDIEIDFRNGALSARLNAASAWAALTSGAGPLRFQLDSPTGRVNLDFEDVAGSVDRLTMNAGGSAPKILVRVRP